MALSNSTSGDPIRAALQHVPTGLEISGRGSFRFSLRVTSVNFEQGTLAAVVIFNDWDDRDSEKVPVGTSLNFQLDKVYRTGTTEWLLDPEPKDDEVNLKLVIRQRSSDSYVSC